jgi:vacuolar-type H+-ATPase subunit I/STV1
MYAVFFVVVSAERIAAKCRRVAESLGAALHDLPPTRAALAQLVAETGGRVRDLRTVVDRSLEHQHAFLSRALVHVDTWFRIVDEVGGGVRSTIDRPAGTLRRAGPQRLQRRHLTAVPHR